METHKKAPADFQKVLDCLLLMSECPTWVRRILFKECIMRLEKISKMSCLLVSAIALFSSVFCYAETGYIFCIEGGGSKTILQVLDKNGEIVSLIKNAAPTDAIIGAGVNINVIGQDGVRKIINTLLENAKIESSDKQLKDLFQNSEIVMGMPGITISKNRDAIMALLEERGIKKEQMHVIPDAEMALELIDNEGIILIAGTGSVCFGKKGKEKFRVGGLGSVLGDEGAGYQIGLRAIKEALADEYGWGGPTALTAALREFFQVTELKTVIPTLGVGGVSPARIASMAPIVFEKAWANDRAAKEVIDIAAKDLGDLLSKMLTLSKLHDCEVHLYGGIFRNAHSEEFIEKIKQQLPKQKNLKFINKSHDNPTTLYATKYLLRK